MARIVRVVKTLRNHWKKSTFGFLLLSYGCNYAYEKYRTHELIKSYCEEAQSFGDVPSPVGTTARQITVLLNPASNGGKGKTDFEKYCAPLLYLSGMKVSVVKTESIGEARGLMEVMDNCDGIVVAGGDGALSEAVTGLLRRSDNSSAAQRFPVGIIPVGKNNNVAKAIFKEFKNDRIKLMAEATMAVVRDSRRSVDVMRIQIQEVDETEGQQQTGKPPIYALGELKWGAFRDVEDQVSKYWIWGPLKPYMAYLFMAYRDLTWSCKAQLRYTLPCEGCRECTNLMKVDSMINQQLQQQNSRWWHAFIPRTKSSSTNSKIEKDYSKIINPECGIWHEKNVSTVEFQALTQNNLGFSKHDMGPKQLEIKLGPETIGGFQFIKEGWLRNQEKSEMKQEKIVARQFQMIPQNDQELREEEQQQSPTQITTERWYSIDNDNYEVKPVLVTLLPNAIRMFAIPITDGK